MVHLRWWADRVGKPNLVQADNASYGIGDRRLVTNEDRSRDLPPDKLAQVEDAHVRMALQLKEAFGLRHEEAIKCLAVLRRPGSEDRAQGVLDQGRSAARGPGADGRPAPTARRGAGLRRRRHDDLRPQELQAAVSSRSTNGRRRTRDSSATMAGGPATRCGATRTSRGGGRQPRAGRCSGR